MNQGKMYQGPVLPPLTVLTEDPPAPHVHPVEAIVGLRAQSPHEEGLTHVHMTQDITDLNLWEQLLWVQVHGG